MQILYVDLKITSTGHAGTLDDPMSWSQLGSVLQSVSNASLDTGDSFDQGLRFDATSLDMTVFLMNYGVWLSDAFAISVSKLRCSPGSKITFKTYNPVENGLAVLFADYSATSFMLKLTNAVNLSVVFDGIAFSLDTNPNGSSTFSLAVLDQCVACNVSFMNCIATINGYSTKLIDVKQGDSSSTALFSNNTVAYGASSLGQHEIARAEGCQLTFTRNAIAQASQALSQVICATSTLKLVGGGNAIASNSSVIVYNAVSASLIESDYIGLNVSRQLLWNPKIIDGNREDCFAGIKSGLTMSRATAFQLVHYSPGQAAGTNKNLAYTNVDAFGFDRPAGSVDAGALQKSGISTEILLHVDLSLSGLTASSGTESDPLTLTDFELDYGRRAPVDSVVNYVFRNSNTAVVPLLNLGPESPNISASSQRYYGSGKVLMSAYKPYRKKLPVLKVCKIAPNASSTIEMKSLKILFTGGSTPNLIEPTVSGTGKFRLSNCGIYSDTTAVGMIASMSTNSVDLQLFGCSIAVNHANGLNNGVFGATNSVVRIECCMIDSPVSTIGNGGATTINGSMFSTPTGTASWTGASHDAFLKTTSSQVFSDKSIGDFNVANNAGVQILPTFKTLSTDAFESLTTDARDLKRTSSTDGSYDAGMYETGVYVPPAKNYYVDLAKSKSGLGIQADKWSTKDLAAWLASKPFVDCSTNIIMSKAGHLSAEISDIDFNFNGLITFKSENKQSPSTVYCKDFSVLYGQETQVPVSISGLIVASSNTSSLINLPNVDLTAINSIFSIFRSEAVTYFYLMPSASNNSTITVTTSESTHQIVEGVDWFLSQDLKASAASLSKALVKIGCNSIVSSTRIEVSGIVSITSSDSTIVFKTANVGLMSKTATVAGCSFAETIDSSLTIQSNVLVASSVDVNYSAVASSGAYTGFYAFDGSVKNSVFSGVTNRVLNGLSETNNHNLASPIFLNGFSEIPEASDFSIANVAMLKVVNESDVNQLIPEYKLDIFGNMRSQAYESLDSMYDAGAVETSILSSNKAFDPYTDSVMSYMTEAGVHLNARAKSGHIVFKLTGFNVSNSGYVYWNPTLVDQTKLGDGKQAKAKITVSSNASWTSDSVSVMTPLGTVIVRHGTDFSHGATAADTAKNIAASLRSNQTFNKAAWTKVQDNTIEVYSWLYGSLAVGYNLSSSSSNLTVLNFSGSENQSVSSGISWPSVGHSPWFKIEKPDLRSVSFCARLSESDALGPIGELAVIATVISSPFDSEVGTTYVYARIRTPLHVKTSAEIMTRRFIMCF
jgi:hypothetical protein